MRYCPEKDELVDEKKCEDCLFYKPQNILSPCLFKKDKCKNCKKNDI